MRGFNFHVKVLFVLSMLLIGSSIFSTSGIFLNKTGRDIWIESKGETIAFSPSIVKKGLLKNNKILHQIYAGRLKWIKIRNAKREVNEAGQAVESIIANQVQGRCARVRVCTLNPIIVKVICKTRTINHYYLEDPRMVRKLLWNGVMINRGRGVLGVLTTICGKAKVQKGVFYTGFSIIYEGIAGTPLRFIITLAPNGKDFYLTGVGRRPVLKHILKDIFVQPGKFMKAAQKASLQELLPFPMPSQGNIKKGLRKKIELF